MEATGGRGFQSKLSQMIEVQSERDKLYQHLKDYQLNHDISAFVDSLKAVVSHPDQLILFDDVRPFIQPSQQNRFNELIPSLPSKRMRTIHLTRQGSENLGFAVRGGIEFNVGVFVSEVNAQSAAARKGLKVGDKIVRVNGYSIKHATHSEVISALTTSKTLVLKIKNIGMLPLKNDTSEPVTWKFVPRSRPSIQVDSGSGSEQTREADRKVFVNLQSGKKLGCGIGTGQNNEPGIFILKISTGSLADMLNFKVGDQILDVNGTSFLNISHDAAVMELKSGSQLTMTLRSKEVKDGKIKPLEKSKNLLVSADVSPIPAHPTPKQTLASPETGEKQLLPQDQGLTDQDDVHVDGNKTQLSSNWSVKKKKHPDEYSQNDETTKKSDKENMERSTKSKQVQGSRLPESFWNKDPYTLFTHHQIDGRQLSKVEINKAMPLEMDIEGGLGSPLAGRVVISEIYPGGAADCSGELFKGDQLMMVDGQSMIDISLDSAQGILKKSMEKQDGAQNLQLITALSPTKNYEDNLTYF